MNLFISWSGERSRKVAEALQPWLKCVLQNIDPFFSQNDIDGGSVWIDNLYKKLSVSNAGIICLTPENLHSQWIQFEAGALAKGLLENRVFILLIGIESHQVVGPMASFNHTFCTKEGIQKMIRNLNDLLGEKGIAPEILTRVFAKNYSDLEDILQSVIEMKAPKSLPPQRDSAEIQNEMLNILRGLSSRISNVEKSIDQNNSQNLSKKFIHNDKWISYDYSNNLLKKFYELSENEKTKFFNNLNNAEIGEELSGSSSVGGGV